MNADATVDRFPLSWRACWGVALGVWTVVLAGLGMASVTRGFLRLRWTDAVALSGASAYAAWVLEYALVSGVLGVGVTYAYLRARTLDAAFVVSVPEGADARLLSGLVALVAGLTVVDDVLAPLVGGPSASGFLAPFSMSGPAPVASLESELAAVVGTVFLAGLAFTLVGPGVAALVHGVLQNTLQDAASPRTAVWATALLFAGYRTATESGAFVAAAVTFALYTLFAAAVGTAYERSGNLLLPMVAYGLLTATSLLVGSVAFLADVWYLL